MLRILHLSDLNLRSGREEEIVKAIRQLGNHPDFRRKADYLVVCGNLTQSAPSFAPFALVWDALKDLVKPDPGRTILTSGRRDTTGENGEFDPVKFAELYNVLLAREISDDGLPAFSDKPVVRFTRDLTWCMVPWTPSSDSPDQAKAKTASAWAEKSATESFNICVT